MLGNILWKRAQKTHLLRPCLNNWEQPYLYYGLHRYRIEANIKLFFEIVGFPKAVLTCSCLHMKTNTMNHIQPGDVPTNIGVLIFTKY